MIVPVLKNGWYLAWRSGLTCQHIVVKSDSKGLSLPDNFSRLREGRIDDSSRG